MAPHEVTDCSVRPQPVARLTLPSYCRAPTKRVRRRSTFNRGTQMTKTELNKFKAILTGRQSELTPLLWKRDGIAIEKTPDALDEVQLATERELATRNLARESKLLRNVRAALGRIDEGTYGICLHCEEEIGAKRLNALPWTPLCIECQKKADRSAELGLESQEWLIGHAA